MTEHLLTQVEVEEHMYSGGVERMRRRMQEAEEKGSADRNPYAATILRDFVLPLAALLTEEVTSARTGRAAAHIQLLRPLDLEAVAVLAVRNTLSLALQAGEQSLRTLSYAVGAAIHNELVLAQIEEYNPDLYYTLAQDFNRKRSKGTRHRMTVFRMQAEKAGIVLDSWSAGSRDQIGLYLLDRLQALGMVTIDTAPVRADGKKRAGKRMQSVYLSDGVLQQLDDIKGLVEVTAPVYGPCVEPPRDWVSVTDGGFHTQRMRRTCPYMVKAVNTARELLRDHQMPVVLSAINSLQRTAWAINGGVLDVIQELARTNARTTGEIITGGSMPKPERPAWLDSLVGDVKALPPAQQAEFVAWKHDTRDWYTARKLASSAYSRFYSATRVATTFRNYPSLYFVHFADSRGRLYPLTYGVSPQGSDMQKALLHFAQGKPLHTEAARRWFLIHGANKWGFDKASLDERAAWHEDKQQLLMAIASDPVNNLQWQQADNPLQFLAWCLEYAEFRIDPYGFESRIPVSMDGTCNGLQNFSAMLRDEVGGRATNLTNSATMEDIYTRVAQRAEAAMRAAPADDAGMRERWLAQGIERSVVKRSVMTTPYGVTRRSATVYVIKDYLELHKAAGFTRKDYFAAASYLMGFVWPAIGEVVVKSREAMDWLHNGARQIIKKSGRDLDGVISWVTPSGFLATQAYYQVEEHRIRTRLQGETKIKVVVDGDLPCPSSHAGGLAPNFVHSMDAAHLHLTAAAAHSRGIMSLAMIHDDYGTHAADAEALYHLIRECFVSMYENHDPIGAFHTAYPMTGTPPLPGTLDIREVLDSQYFFS